MTREQLQTIFESEFSWDNWKEVMNFVFPEFKFNLVQTDLTRDTKAHKKNAGYIKEYGSTQLASPETLTLCEILVSDNVRLDRNIKSVRSLVADLAVPNYQTVIAVFHNADNTKWRFTLVVKEFTGNHKTYDKKPDSYTYVFGIGEKGRTASERFLKLAGNTNKTLKDLEEAFSVEALSKKFFKEYKDIYQRFVEGIIKNPSRLALFKETSKDKQEKSARDFVKKMMGRLVFLYFLQKKGWLGCKTKWKEGDEAFMKTFANKAKQNDLFYLRYLEPLFFDTLNAKRTKQDEDCIIEKTNFGKVPYLNGGLFEKDENHPKGLTLKWETFEAFFDTLNSYNFTIIEDDPEFKEVAVDPEMLGHIFENLLEDNKDKGAYYTPKEIVHYMCQESLYEYLKTYVQQNKHWPQGESDGQQLEKSLQRFVKQKLAAGVIDYDKLLAKALKEVRICDPAIGSGAFPMGLLNEIYHCVHKLHDESPDKVGDVWGIGKVWQGSKVKLNIIQNSIYGVDTEKGAVDIARLRFWLSLIIDEDQPEPLPNLDFKIVVGDSLVPKFENNELIIDWDIKLAKVESERPGLKTTQTKLNEEIQKLQRENLDKVVDKQRQYFNADEADKARIQNEIKLLKLEIVLGQVRQELLKTGKLKESYGQTSLLFATAKKQPEKYLEILQNEASLKRLEKAITKKIKNRDTDFSHFDWRLDFPEILNEALTDKPGFDIVIANPPYLNVELMEKDLKAYFKKRFKTFYKRTDIFGVFLEFSLTHLLKPSGKLAYIIPSIVLNNLSYKLLRNEILNNNWLSTVCYTGNNIFSEVTVDTVILILNKEGNRNIKLTEALDFKIPKTTIVPSNYFEKFDNAISVSNDNNSSGLFEKIFDKANINLETHFDIFQGIVTGNNPVYIFDEPERLIGKKIEKELLKPLVQGRDFGKWIIKNTERRILYLSPKMDIEDYPLTKKYLLPFKEELDKRRECLNGAIPWYSLQWARDKALLDIKPKILIQRTRNERLKDRIVATVDEIGLYSMESTFVMTPKDGEYSIYFLIAIINSKLINYLFATKLLNLAIKGDHLKKLTFPKPSHQLMQELIGLSKTILSVKQIQETKEQEDLIDYLVYKLYKLAYDEVKVVDPNFSISESDYNELQIA